MDTLYSTKTEGKYSRGNTCCQILITDKSFLYFVPMKIKSEVLQAVKKFVKEIGAPNAIILNAAGEKTSKALRKYISGIRTTLKYLEEGTPWENKAKLSIGLIKDALHKDMKYSDLPRLN